MSTSRVSVFGAGSWGTALAVLLARKGIEVCLWGRDPEQMALMRRERANRRYLPGASFPDTLRLSDHLDEAAAFGEMAVLAVPSSGMEAMADSLGSAPLAARAVVSAAKGLHGETGERMSRVIARRLAPPLAVLSGPNLAVELARQVPTATVIASEDKETARQAQQAFRTPLFRVYTSSDVVGVELGGSLKNIIAIAAGIGDGLGYGNNTKATLMTRGLAEMTRLGVASGANPQTFLGLAGVGDLVATCASPLSRNWKVGDALGRGLPMEEALASTGQVAEGVPTTRAACRLAEKAGVDMPITAALYRILYENTPLRTAIADLMSREGREEEF
ncbi:MAG: NAD(P)-dependent glycerol-3-phosphate dehydrogenase [Armatimonadetes bacterium]|nr:NAD(P)-dependent glycerol-3-phosphate dehydrogenase [Armatimonadota bacterium]